MTDAPAPSRQTRSHPRESEWRRRSMESALRPAPTDVEKQSSPASTDTGLTPPAVSYASFKSILRTLKEQAGPLETLDLHSPKYKMRSANRLDMLRAFRFLELVDGDGLPTKRLADLVRSLDTAAWPSEVHSMVVAAYAALLETSAIVLSGGGLIPGFRAAYGAQGDATRRGAEFFMHAARDAEVETSSRRLRPAPCTKAGFDDTHDLGTGRSLPHAGHLEAVRALVAKLPSFDAHWPNDVKCLWLRAYIELVQRLEE